MKPRSRSFFILTSTLLIGMLLGALVHARFFDKRVKRVHRMSTPDGFVQSYVDTLQPTDPTQEAAIREIVAAVAEDVAASIRKNREENGARLGAMSDKLQPLLTDEQEQRLTARHERFRKKSK